MSETITKARRNDWFEGDVTVNHDLTVGGSLRAKRIKQPLLGLYSSGESLASQWPEPVVGMWAIVGRTSPFIIWRCDEDGVWTNTGIVSSGFDGVEVLDLDASHVLYSNNNVSYEGKTNLKEVLDMLISITPKFQSANWLEDEEGWISGRPETRKPTRYTSMVNAINENRLIKLFGNTATSASVEQYGDTGEMTLTFMVTDSSGVTKTLVYIVHYTTGAEYCTVQKIELPLPSYDASWIKSSGSGTQEDYHALNDAIALGLPIRIRSHNGVGPMPGYYTAIGATVDNGGRIYLTFIVGIEMVTYTVQWDTDHAVSQREVKTIAFSE